MRCCPEQSHISRLTFSALVRYGLEPSHISHLTFSALVRYGLEMESWESWRDGDFETWRPRDLETWRPGRAGRAGRVLGRAVFYLFINK